MPMSFEDRNVAWAGNRREFRQLQSRSSSPRVWIIEVTGNQIHTWWGQLGGVLQPATETLQGVNLGKKNEVSGPEYALQRAREMCRKKDREGYREFANNAPIDQIVERLITFDNLPTSLCFYKPDNTMGPGITKKAVAGQVWYSRKRNGLAYVIARGIGGAKMYSRRMFRQHDDETNTNFTWDDRFPHIVEAANAIMPENSILLGELVATRGGVDDLKLVESYTKSLTPQSIQDQKLYGRPSFVIWDIAFWEGRDLVSKAPVKTRYELIHELPLALYNGILEPVEFYISFKNPAEAIAFAKKKGWEGFVVVDPEGLYGDKAFNFKGKPDRPGQVCAKLKPEYEDDFVVLWDPEKGIGERSTKESTGLGVKSVALFQYNKNGELIYISQCSSGMTKEMKISLANPSLFPQVWEVAYTDRRYVHEGDQTNALDFPRFVRVRVDKTPRECVTAKLVNPSK